MADALPAEHTIQQLRHHRSLDVCRWPGELVGGRPRGKEAASGVCIDQRGLGDAAALSCLLRACPACSAQAPGSLAQPSKRAGAHLPR